MTGAKDPDCRRGMLWDESRQDKDMLHWYRRLIQLRKEIPAITEGKIRSQKARDAEGLICITRVLNGQEVTVLFSSRDTAVDLPELAGKTDLLSGSVFSGHLECITAMVLQ